MSEPRHAVGEEAVWAAPPGPGGGVATTSRDAEPSIDSPDSVVELLRKHDYLAGRGLSTSIYLALSLGQPLLLEGEAGVGKTEVAKAAAAALGRRLVRLQCYEGIDSSEALYEWDYPRQLLYLKAITESGAGRAEQDVIEDLFSPRFLVERPLLTAVREGAGAVLLVDEVDRADEEFEAFLLEVLSDFQVSIPEIGTVAADQPPFVVLTSNRTRDLHDALKRRCLYHWIDYPDVDREVEIVTTRAPEVGAALSRAVAETVARLRALDLEKAPGVAETINWARVLALLGVERLEAEAVEPTLGSVLKDRDDVRRVRKRLDEVLAVAGPPR